MNGSVTDFNMNENFECDLFVSLNGFPSRAAPHEVDGIAAKFSYHNGIAKLILSNGSMGNVDFHVNELFDTQPKHVSSSYDGHLNLLYGLAWNRESTYIIFENWHVTGGKELNREKVSVEIQVDSFRVLSSQDLDDEYHSAAAVYLGLEQFIKYKPFHMYEESDIYESKLYDLNFENESYEIRFGYDTTSFSEKLFISQVAQPVIIVTAKRSVMNKDQIDRLLRSLEDLLLLLMDSKNLCRRQLIGNPVISKSQTNHSKNIQNIFVGYYRQTNEEFTMGRRPSITLKDVESNFQLVLDTWLSNTSLRKFVKPYLIFYKNKMTPEANFVSMMSAIDIYYNKLKYAGLPDYISKAVTPSNQKQCKDKKSSGHTAATAVQKIMFLIHNLPENIKQFLFHDENQETVNKRIYELAQIMNKNRNHIVHGSGGNGPGIVKRDEYIVSILEILVFIFLTFTWNKLGVPENVILNCINRDFSDIVNSDERIKEFVNPLVK